MRWTLGYPFGFGSVAIMNLKHDHLRLWFTKPTDNTISAKPKTHKGQPKPKQLQTNTYRPTL